MANKEKYSFFPHPETFDHYLTPSRFRFITKGKLSTELIDEYIASPDDFIRTFTVVINGKRRKIVTYQPNEKGAALRNLQRLFVCVLNGLHTPSNHSYAYIEGCSTKSCLEQHLQNDHFLKTDIHAYFDIVSFELLRDRLFALSPLMRKQHAYWSRILSACFYDGKMPIGFISSPILSDLFLKDVDERFGNMDGINYTRYADDFIISAAGDQADQQLQYALAELKREMDDRHLELNKKKTYFRQLRQEGDAIHLLGLNLVRTESGDNRITVSDRYIRETSKELCQLIQEKNQLNDWEARKRFCAVMGKVGYITYASEQSAQKLQKMLHVKTGMELALDYKSLQLACMSNPQANVEYGKKQYYAAYAKAIGFRPLLPNGLVWERASVRAATEKEKQALGQKEFQRQEDNSASAAFSEWFKEWSSPQKDESRLSELRQRLKNPQVEDTLTRQERNDAYRRAYTLGGLKYYIMALCRATDGILQIHNVRLTIGSETVVATSNADVQALREHARKLRGTNEAVSFFAHYQYSTPNSGKYNKFGNVYIQDGSFRPLLGMAGGASIAMDSCAVYNPEEKIWMLTNKDGKWNEQALVDCDQNVLTMCSNWCSDIDMDIYWPLSSDELTQSHIENLISCLPAAAEAENGCRTIRFHEKLHLAAEQAVTMVETLRELSAAVKQIEGEVQFECSMCPADYAVNHEDRPLDLVCITASKNGRIVLKTGKF